MKMPLPMDMHVVGGLKTRLEPTDNCWVSNEIENGGEWISFNFNKIVHPKQINLKFDSNLAKQIMVSLSHSVISSQVPGIPLQLVKDYDIEFYKGNELVHSEVIKDNYLRFKVHNFANEIDCDKVRINITSTNGDKHARFFEVRIYE